jgi:hypothetical protein
VRAVSASPRGATTTPTTTATNSTSNSNNSNNKTPFLTLVLLKLDGLLDEYCLLLSSSHGGSPSYYENAVRASVLMESCIAASTAATTTTSTNVLPPRTTQHHPVGGSPSSRMGAALSSLMTRSPNNNAQIDHSPSNRSTGSTGSAGSFARWLQQSPVSSFFVSSSSSSSAQSVAMALQGEWESYQRPFLLLAAALVLYMDMQHVHNISNSTSNISHDSASATSAIADSLQGLFLYLALEFQAMEQTLCGPFLDMIMTNKTSSSNALTSNSSTTATATTGSGISTSHAASSGNNKYSMAATHVAQTLRTLTVICQARCRLIALQCNLFSSSRDLEHSKDELAVVCAMTTKSMKSVAVSESTRIIAAPSVSGDGGGSGGDSNDRGEESTTSIIKKTSCSSSCLLGEALLQELDMWKHCLNAAAGLESCQ